jgi:hypothetical protein
VARCAFVSFITYKHCGLTCFQRVSETLSLWWQNICLRRLQTVKIQTSILTLITNHHPSLRTAKPFKNTEYQFIFVPFSISPSFATSTPSFLSSRSRGKGYRVGLLGTGSSLACRQMFLVTLLPTVSRTGVRIGKLKAIAE